MLIIRLIWSIVGIWAAFKFAGVAIEWLRVGIEKIKPPKKDDFEDFFDKYC